MRAFVVLFLLLCILSTSAQRNSPLLDSIMKSSPDLLRVYKARGTYQPQVIYTRINRDGSNKPVFSDYYFDVDSSRYFYCASLVKLPCSIFALEKLNDLHIRGLDRNSAMLTDSAAVCQATHWRDTSSASGYPSVGHHISKMLLVSDNNSFSRIFEFLGPSHINRRMSELGFPQARVVHRFDVACVGVGNKYMNPMRFLDEYGKVVYSQKADSVPDFTPPLPVMKAGKDLYNKRKRQISAAKDFSKSNYLSLRMIHNILRGVVFNKYQPAGMKFRITDNDQQFLMNLMGMYPRESQYPKYNADTYIDALKKYFIYGGSVATIGEDTVRIFNIVGRAYGFISDCAYIVNMRTGVEFMLSAVLYVNKSNSFGSGNYEYDAVGLPFLRELSLALYALESSRKKKNLPDLSELRFYSSPK
jgi:hypothetical protein